MLWLHKCSNSLLHNFCTKLNNSLGKQMTWLQKPYWCSINHPFQQLRRTWCDGNRTIGCWGVLWLSRLKNGDHPQVCPFQWYIASLPYLLNHTSRSCSAVSGRFTKGCPYIPSGPEEPRWWSSLSTALISAAAKGSSGMHGLWLKQERKPLQIRLPILLSSF